MELACRLRPNGRVINAKLQFYKWAQRGLPWRLKDPGAQISDDLKIFFIHIPKCGGTSIDNSKLFEGRGRGHRGYYGFKQLLAEHFCDYKCFALVRNPWDRLASAFYYISERGSGSNFDVQTHEKHFSRFGGCFRSFLECFCEDPGQYLSLLHFRPMITFLNPKKIEIPFMCQRLEEISELEELRQFIGYDLRMRHDRQRKTYANVTRVFDAELFSSVGKIYSDDVNAFGYSSYTLDKIAN